MGGCYSDYSSRSVSSSYSAPKKVRKPANPKWQQLLKSFAKNHELSDLLSANRAFFRNRKKGFIAKLSEFSGLRSVSDIPKEFPEMEYEVKINVEPSGMGKEPEVVQYLDAFDFPVGSSSRFIKDPINNFAVGINHFIGDSLDERLVVIEKAGGTYLKEKGLVVPLDLGIQYEDIIVKRTEERHQADMSEVLGKVKRITSEKGVEYRGKIRKEKGDAFLLDTSDGRIYSFTITRAHLTKAGDSIESGTQRQLEIEYAGYIPGFRGFEKDSEKQLVQGMVDLAKYTFAMYNNAPISDGWRMNLQVTEQRKYDFVLGKDSREISPKKVLQMIGGKLEYAK
jgi:hypothetical protein